MQSARSPPRPTQSWRDCLYPCRLSWGTGTVCRRRTSSRTCYAVYSTARSGLASGNGISARWHMESVNCCQTSPEPKTTQHLFVAAPQTVRTWQRGCGLCTKRPKGRQKVWTAITVTVHSLRYSTASDTGLLLSHYNPVMTDVYSRSMHHTISTASLASQAISSACTYAIILCFTHR